MTVVSSKEFESNENKYFDMAMNEKIFVKRDNMMFILSCVNDHKPKKRLKPDDDLRRAITMDEFRKRALEDLDVIFANK